ncbi:hypothetical protein SLA2020_156970 [Shorea laevis]
MGVASNRFAVIAEVEESSGVIPDSKEADSGSVPAQRENEPGQSNMDIAPSSNTKDQVMVAKVVDNTKAQNKSGRKKDKTKKVLGPVVKPSKPSRSKSLDPTLIQRSISDEPKQLLCVAASPPISFSHPVEDCSRQSSGGLNGSMNLPNVDPVPPLPPSAVVEHVLGNLGVQQPSVL